MAEDKYRNNRVKLSRQAVFDWNTRQSPAAFASFRRLQQRNELRRLMKTQPALLAHEWFQEVAAGVRECGNLSLY